MLNYLLSQNLNFVPQCILLTEAAALPTAYFLLTELTKRGRSVEMVFRAETAADYDALAERVTEAALLLVVVRNKIDNVMTRCFLHFAAAHDKPMLLINADRSALLVGWASCFIADHAASFRPESPMELPSLALGEEARDAIIGRICQVIDACKQAEEEAAEKAAASAAALTKDESGNPGQPEDVAAKHIEEWSNTEVRKWLGRFSNEVADFFHECEGKEIYAIAKALESNDGEALINLLAEIHRGSRRRRSEMGAVGGGGRGRGGGSSGGEKEVRMSCAEEDAALSLTIPLAVITLKRHFLDLIVQLEAEADEEEEKEEEAGAGEAMSPSAICRTSYGEEMETRPIESTFTFIEPQINIIAP